MRYMLDTNICIYVIKHKPESVFRELKSSDRAQQAGIGHDAVEH